MEENQGKQVASMLNEFGKKLTEMMGKGKDEARTMARAAQIGIEIMTLEGLHLELMMELGEAFYDASGKKGKAKAKAQQNLVNLVARAREIEKKVASLKRALKRPGAEGTGRRRGRPPKAEKAPAKKAARRGRPPKAAKAPAKKPARRGRPPKVAKAPAKKAARRGRPPKAAAPAAAPKPAAAEATAE